MKFIVLILFAAGGFLLFKNKDILLDKLFGEMIKTLEAVYTFLDEAEEKAR